MKNIFFLIFITVSFFVYSQTQDEIVVSLTSTGTGNSIESAKINALNNATSQVYNVYISKDRSFVSSIDIKSKIVSDTNNLLIEKYDVVNTTIIPDGTFAVTLKVKFNISKIILFCQSKGTIAEFKGGVFATNIKSQILNEEAEIKTIWDALFMINPILNQSFDYNIKTMSPKVKEGNNNLFEVPILISVNTNRNIDFVFDFLKKSLSLISLSQQELNDYTSLGKKTFQINIDNQVYYLRKEESSKAVDYFFEEVLRVMRNYRIEDGFTYQMGYEFYKMNNYNEKFIYNESYNTDNSDVNYPFKMSNSTKSNSVGYNYITEKSSRTIMEIKFNRVYNLEGIENITNFIVFSGYNTSKLGAWYNGGRIYYIDDNNIAYICPLSFDNLNYLNVVNRQQYKDDLIYDKYGYIIKNTITDTLIGSGSPNTLKILDAISNYNIPQKVCNDFAFNGFYNWFLPSINELEKLLEFNYNYSKATCNPYSGRDFISSSRNPNDISNPFSFYSIEPHTYGNCYDYGISFNVRSDNIFNIDEYTKIIPIRKEKLFDSEPLNINPNMYSNTLVPYLKSNGKWIFVDSATMTQVIRDEFDYVDFFNEGLAVVGVNNKQGFINKKGELVIPIVYDNANRFIEGLAAVSIGNKWGFIDKNGKVVVSLKYDRAIDFSEGLAAVCIQDKWGFINNRGEIVIPLKYKNAGKFLEGLAWVEKNESNNYVTGGFIDKTGNTVIPFNFEGEIDMTPYFSEGLAFVYKHDKGIFIDKKGNTALISEFVKYGNVGSLSEGMAWISDGYPGEGKIGFIDKNGKIVLPYKYFDMPGKDNDYSFSENLAPVASLDNKKMGYIDKLGNVVIPFVFSYANQFKNGLASVSDDNGTSWYYIDKSGRKYKDNKINEYQPPFVNSKELQGNNKPVAK
jgi:hypothetical protein